MRAPKGKPIEKLGYAPYFPIMRSATTAQKMGNYLLCRRVDMFGVALAFACLFISSHAAASGTSVVAHRAFYKMSLGERLQNSPIVNVNGKSAFVMERDCEGWRSIEDYALEFVGESGANEQVLSHFESWESDGGDKYSFDISESSTFVGQKMFGGFAQKGTGGTGVASFSVEPDAEISLPDDVYFPVGHLENILQMADDGQTIVAASIFTGAEPDNALMKTSTVVGNWQDAVETGQFGTNALAEDGFWPVRVAYFRPSAETAEPEYEINFLMQRNGIVREYEIDYGDFSILADLTRLEDVTSPDCG